MRLHVLPSAAPGSPRSASGRRLGAGSPASYTPRPTAPQKNGHAVAAYRPWGTRYGRKHLVREKRQVVPWRLGEPRPTTGLVQGVRRTPCTGLPNGRRALEMARGACARSPAYSGEGRGLAVLLALGTRGSEPHEPCHYAVTRR